MSEFWKSAPQFFEILLRYQHSVLLLLHAIVHILHYVSVPDSALQFPTTLVINGTVITNFHSASV